MTSLILWLMSFAFAGEKYVLEEKGSTPARITIEVNSETGDVTASPLGRLGSNPKRMELTLMRADGGQQTITLQAADSTTGFPQYVSPGAVNPGGGSFVGLQLKFDMPKGRAKLLKWTPPAPDDLTVREGRR